MERTDQDVQEKLSAVAPEARRRDAETLVELMRDVTGREPALWSGGIIGFGSVHYVYRTGTEGDSPILGFAPRKASTTVYLLDGVPEHADELAQLGPHERGAGCLYLKDLEKVDASVLRGIVQKSYEWVTGGGSDDAVMTVTD